MITQTNYSDLDLGFGKTLKRDIAKVTNDRAISQSIRNIVMIKSLLFRRNWGTGLESYFFNLLDPITLDNLRDQVEQAIKQKEPRISGLKVVTQANQINNALTVIVYYMPKGSSKVLQVSMTLDIFKK